MRDTVLKGIWVYSYSAIVRLFRLVQRIEPLQNKENFTKV
jgi:hypothetical protein